MSYILDALKKSEQQRLEGEIPGVHSRPSLSPPPSRKPSMRLLYTIIVLLLLNAGVLVWLFSPWSRKPVTGSSEEFQQDAGLLENTEPETTPSKALSRHLPGEGSQTCESPIGSREAEAQRTSREKSPRIVSRADSQAFSGESQSAARSRESGRKASICVPSSLETKKSAPPSKVPVRQAATWKNPAEEAANQLMTELRKIAGATGGPQAVIDSVEPGRTDQLHREQTLVSPGTDIIGRFLSDTIDGQKIQSASEPMTPLTHATGRDRSPADGSQLQSDSGAKKPNIPDFRELPLKLQHQVPSMSFSMLVYSENPNERMISINGKIVREGEEVFAGLKLERIMPDWAVFRFKGARFRKSIF